MHHIKSVLRVKIKDWGYPLTVNGIRSLLADFDDGMHRGISSNDPLNVFVDTEAKRKK